MVRRIRIGQWLGSLVSCRISDVCVVLITHRVCPVYRFRAIIPCELPVWVVYHVEYSIPFIMTGAYLGSYCEVVQ